MHKSPRIQGQDRQPKGEKRGCEEGRKGERERGWKGRKEGWGGKEGGREERGRKAKEEERDGRKEKAIIVSNSLSRY